MSARRSRVAGVPLLDWGDTLRARKRQRKRGVRFALAGAIFGLALLATAAFPPSPRLVWNVSASAPEGLYLVSPGALARPGELVIARIPARFRRLAATRHYLPMNVPLVKRVAASAGDEVCAAGLVIRVNGRPIAFRRHVDGAGHPMPLWSGCLRLRGSQLFLLMEASTSFDGRYFGVTDGADIVGKARLLWAR